MNRISQHILIIFLFTATVAFSQSLKIHTANGIDEYLISEIDSITFSTTTSIPTNGLLAYYPFSGNADDHSPNGNHGIVQGATLTADRFGNPNAAYKFDGTDDYIDIGINLKPSFPITIAAWVNLDSINGYTILTNNFTHDLSHGVWFNFDTYGRAAINYGNGGIPGPDSRFTKRGQTMLNVEQWYHITGVVVNEQEMRIYINGVEDGGFYDGNAVQVVYNNGSGNIGRNDPSMHTPPRYFKGTIDEVVFYEKNLTDQEVLQLYQNTK